MGREEERMGERVGWRKKGGDHQEGKGREGYLAEEKGVGWSQGEEMEGEGDETEERNEEVIIRK